MVAGMLPSSFARDKIGSKKDGAITAWESQAWGTGGVGNFNFVGNLPYVLKVENRKEVFTLVGANIGPQRAWRAPNHPQACLITMSAFEDMAAELKMDPLEMFLENLPLAGDGALVYR